jgi:hypothetical protein
LEYILHVSYPRHNREFWSLPRNKAVLLVCEEEDDDCLRRNYCSKMRNYYCLRNYCSTYCGNDYLRNYCSTYYDNDCSKKRHEGLVVLEVWDDGGDDGGGAREVCDDGDAQVSPVDKVFPLVCDDGDDDAWRNCCSKKNYSKKKNCSKKKKKN